ncbi:MAG TPA: riboflavin synthase [Rhodothermales bacterium]|nr:riboflavin synthase [Rhodothermales bacterium]
MFTGIIEEVGRVVAVEDLGGGRRLTIEAALAPLLGPDQSIAVNGACQTVVAVDGNTFDVVAVEETLSKTTFGLYLEGVAVNLERAMLPTSRLDGHFVQGHVDATGTVVDAEVKPTSRLYRVGFGLQFAPFLIPVGSITIDGISLTVARLSEDELTVSIIPHTYEHTAIAANWEPGAPVNLEFDLIGKYIARNLALLGKDEGAGGLP